MGEINNFFSRPISGDGISDYVISVNILYILKGLTPTPQFKRRCLQRIYRTGPMWHGGSECRGSARFQISR